VKITSLILKMFDERELQMMKNNRLKELLDEIKQTIKSNQEI